MTNFPITRARLFIGLALIGISLIFQFSSVIFIGHYVNFVLATLIALAFYLNSLELLFLAILSEFVLLPAPQLGIIPFLLVLLPFVAFVLQRLFPVSTWLTNIAVTMISIPLLYLVADASFLFLNPYVFALDEILSMAWGVAVFSLINWAV